MAFSAAAVGRAAVFIGSALMLLVPVACTTDEAAPAGSASPSAGPASPSPGSSARPAASGAGSSATSPDLILATTTSTLDSGLLDVIVPAFEAATEYVAKPVAVGSGQALKMGAEGNADVLLVHSPTAERGFVASGAGIARQLVMHNWFLVVGPPADPAGIRGGASAGEALSRILETGSTFVSRGDGSGTHTKELGYWQESGLDPAGDRYLETGQGMAGTLRIASEKAGYTLVDSATWAAMRDEVDLEPLLTADPSLLNPYHVIRVNPAPWPRVNAAGAEAFAAFLLSPAGQDLIGAFGRDGDDPPLFVPDAGKVESDLVEP